MNYRDRIIVALDTDNQKHAEALIACLKDEITIFKVGKELFTACGPEIITYIHDIGAHCFLDLKYHDIPNTVARACHVATRLGVSMLNVHASGGENMMRAAAEAVRAEAKKIGTAKPLVLAVTVLTSMSEAELASEIGVSRSLNVQVEKLAVLAKSAGCDGVVASAKEIERIKNACGDDFVVVTPGIRPQWAARDDQKRIVTPRDAFRRGVDYIVIGRPITAAEDPHEAARKIIEEVTNSKK